MATALVLPDGIRFPERSELTGSRAERDRLWARIGRTSLREGFVVRRSESREFASFIEANVDAPRLWSVFLGLVPCVLGDTMQDCQLLFGDSEEIHPIASGRLDHWLSLLAPHAYTLAHDGWVQFGLISDHGDQVSGILVTPTKHLQIWAQSREAVVASLVGNGVEEVAELDLLSQYPLILEPLRDLPDGVPGLEEFYARLRNAASSQSDPDPESEAGDDDRLDPEGEAGNDAVTGV